LTTWLTALLFQFATTVTSGPGDWVLGIDVFRGVGTGVFAASSASPAATRILAPWAAGWSHETDRLRVQIRDVTGLDRARLVLSDRLTQEKLTGTIRGADYWVAVRFLPPEARSVPIEVRLVHDDDAATGLAGPPLRLSPDLKSTRVLQAGSRPVFAALTFRDPLEPRERGPMRPPRALRPIQIRRPESIRTPVRSELVLRAMIDSDGSVVEPFVLKPLDPELDAAALRVLQETPFTPGTLNGRPVPAMLTLTCRVS
jgi:Gram-negative bacterial TonB protein C-terminal